MKLDTSRKWLLAGSLGAALLVVVAIIAWVDKSIDIPLIGNNGDVSFSDSTLCSVWESEHESPGVQAKFADAQYGYLGDKLRIPDIYSGERGSVYWSGMLVNCWNARTVGEAFARTDEIVATDGLQGAEQEFQLSITMGIAP